MCIIIHRITLTIFFSWLFRASTELLSRLRSPPLLGVGLLSPNFAFFAVGDLVPSFSCSFFFEPKSFDVFKSFWQPPLGPLWAASWLFASPLLLLLCLSWVGQLDFFLWVCCEFFLGRFLFFGLLDNEISAFLFVKSVRDPESTNLVGLFFECWGSPNKMGLLLLSERVVIERWETVDWVVAVWGGGTFDKGSGLVQGGVVWVWSNL